MIYIVGRTCSGKDTVAKEMCDRYGLKQVVSYTDKPIRTDQTEGVEHYFVDRYDMDYILFYKEIFACTQIGDYRYCATKEECDSKDIYIIDPKGIEDIELQDDDIILYIHISADNRKKRAELRGDEHEKLIKRMSDEDEQFTEFEMTSDRKFCKKIWYVANDYSFERTMQRIDSILTVVEKGVE